SPILTSAHGFFQEGLGVFVSLAAKEGVLAQESQVGELIAFLEGALQRVRPLHRRSAALLLRDHPEHPSIPVVLMNLGDAAAADGDHARAVELTRLAIARGDSPTPLTWGLLVTRCADALDLPCAREAREKVAAWAPSDDHKVRARAAL